MTSLFKGPMHQRIPGHKELSDHVDIMGVEAGSKVFIPLICGPSVNLEILVKEDDRIPIGTRVAQCNERGVVPILASISGTVAGTQKLIHSSLKPVKHLVTKNDGLYERVHSFEPLDYKSVDRTALIDFMINAGIIGLGGASFPAYIKYRFAEDVKKLIINAMECEPFITADFRMIQAHEEESIAGVAAMRKMAMAPETVIAIKETHPDLIQFMGEAVKGMEGFSVVVVPDVYPMGWERVLVREIMHAEYEKLPGEVGTIINNATAAITFDDALPTGTSIVSKTLTVSGSTIKKPVNAQVPVGVPVSEIVAACGGCTCKGVRLIAEGPMMEKAIVDDKFVIDRDMNALTTLRNKPFDSTACLRCGKCSDHCPTRLQPVHIAQAVKADDRKTMERLCTMDYIKYGLCTYICPSCLDVMENVHYAKRRLMLAEK